jgi:hypothetical protein
VVQLHPQAQGSLFIASYATLEVFEPASICTLTEVKVKIMLRSTDSRLVCLGIKHPFGTLEQIFFLCDICWFVGVGRPPLTKGRV